ncbi:hypothetical protein EVAR_70260_1 [Eumeta japonica]|uniref:Uncharacterized protein n=1 Tax=Eumeta variegata TaxID=151549 RepID=A0A4C1SW34_EUMVA|nr:hypothetical protein EVAR_70260_1 [Eumeta japonica]
MSSSRRIRRDDFDIESIESFHDRDNYKSRSSGSRTRSRSRKRSYSRRLDNSSRYRSRSVERKRYSRRRDSYSRSRSRSRGYSRRSDRRKQASGRYRDSRSGHTPDLDLVLDLIRILGIIVIIIAIDAMIMKKEIEEGLLHAHAQEARHIFGNSVIN